MSGEFISAERSHVQESEFIQKESESESKYIQENWSDKVRLELEKVASLDPRPVGSNRKSNPKVVHYLNRWRDLEKCPQLAAFVEEPPDSLPAYIAVKHDPGQRGVDYRPHIFDKVNNSHCLVRYTF